jgi:hypothetical protein
MNYTCVGGPMDGHIEPSPRLIAGHIVNFRGDACDEQYEADREIELNLEHLLLIVKVESDGDVVAPVPTIPATPFLRIVSADTLSPN